MSNKQGLTKPTAKGRAPRGTRAVSAAVVGPVASREPPLARQGLQVPLARPRRARRLETEAETLSEPSGRTSEVDEATARGVLTPSEQERSVADLSEFSVSKETRLRNEGLRKAPERATTIVNEVREALESEAAVNINKEIRDLVIERMYLMQTLVYRLADSRNLLYEEIENGRTRADSRLERRHARALEGVLANYHSLSEELAAVRADTAAVREQLAQAPNAGANILATGEDGEAVSQLKRLTQEVAALRDRDPRSYAEAARAVPPPRAAHTLIVSSRDPRHTADEVLKQIEGAVDARGDGVRVERCRKARDGKVVLGCAERAHADKLVERLRTHTNDLAVEEATNKNPLVEIRNVLAFNKDEEILESIQKQNQTVIAGLDMKAESLRVRFRRRARNPLEAHIVLEASPLLWRRLVDAGVVYVGLQRRPVVDRSPLVQCSRCLAYGHSRRGCRAERDACAHCGGDHMRADCELLAAAAPPACVNCARERRPEAERMHMAFSDACPVRRKWDAIARSRVAYC